MDISTLFRARVFQSSAKLEQALKRPDQEVGPPPASVATAGRMNALGISVFYGATEAGAALAEVRPPVGSRVLIGRFELLKPVRLLDVAALESVHVTGSVFDRGYLVRLKRAMFLAGLSRRITMPIMPDDEPFDYLATQAIADFLATEAIPPLDGILYPSVQGSKGKANVVLFHKAARVEPLDVPKGTEISVYFGSEDDEFGIDFCVSEKVPASVLESKLATLAARPLLEPFGMQGPQDFDERPPALGLDVHSLSVHYVKAVTLDTESCSVYRHRL